jgi:hypothetical protein
MPWDRKLLMIVLMTVGAEAEVEKVERIISVLAYQP